MFSTLFFPIFPWILQIAITTFAIAVGLYLSSIGESIYQVTRMRNEPDCQCTGDASHYMVNSKLETIFE